MVIEIFITKYKGKHKSRKNIHKIVSKFWDVTIGFTKTSGNEVDEKFQAHHGRTRGICKGAQVFFEGNIT